MNDRRGDTLIGYAVYSIYVVSTQQLNHNVKWQFASTCMQRPDRGPLPGGRGQFARGFVLLGLAEGRGAVGP